MKFICINIYIINIIKIYIYIYIYCHCLSSAEFLILLDLWCTVVGRFPFWYVLVFSGLKLVFSGFFVK